MKTFQKIAFSILFTTLPTVILLILRLIFQVDISKIYLPLIAFPLNIFVIAYLYPKKLKIPFGEVNSKEFNINIGLTLNKKRFLNIFLGIILGVSSLSGMLIGSILSGKFNLDFAQLTLKQVVFATVPGVWEEIFFRGIAMLILLEVLKDVKKCIIIQSILFGILHLYGFSFWILVDIISVMFIGLTMTIVANKVNSLIPSIIFHFLHDAFIFLVQRPEEAIWTNIDQILFFSCLWIMLSFNVFITTLFVKYFNIAQEKKLYDTAKFDFQKLEPIKTEI